MCPDCNHVEHDPGKCSKCNCGESELVGLNHLANWYETYDDVGRARPSGGYRVRTARGRMIGESTFE